MAFSFSRSEHGSRGLLRSIRAFPFQPSRFGKARPTFLSLLSLPKLPYQEHTMGVPEKSRDESAIESSSFEKAEVESGLDRPPTPGIDPEAEKRLVRKLDLVLLPLFTAICECSLNESRSSAHQPDHSPLRLLQFHRPVSHTRSPCSFISKSI